MGNLVMRAQDAIRNIRASVHVQIPYIYVHTLSCVVHLNNILAAISLGFTLGSSVAILLVILGLHAWVPKPVELAAQPIWQHLMRASESVVIACITCFVGPMLYNAFLL